MQEFLDMGGYGAYVWGAFGITVLVLIWNAWAARASFKNAKRHAARRVQMQKETP